MILRLLHGSASLREDRRHRHTLRGRYPALAMLSQTTREIIERFWAQRFGCVSEQMRRNGVLVVAHTADLRAYAGLYAYRREATCIVSAPEAYVPPAENALADRTAEDVFDPRELSAVLGAAAGLVVGP